MSLPQHDVELDPRDVGADASVHAQAERDVPIRSPVQYHGVRQNAAGVPVGGGKRDMNTRSPGCMGTPCDVRRYSKRRTKTRKRFTINAKTVKHPFQLNEVQ
ncbi:hypothetical protein, partial [Streptomyces sp. KL116D]|uniref:hypothetical protein n=1 Tax=Streptomyces sp. KL116D TaxID=3045152 RepID=UPI003555CC77